MPDRRHDGLFRGCRRADLLERWVRLMPAERLRFQKQLETVIEDPGGSITLVFADGSREETDIGKDQKAVGYLIIKQETSAEPG